MPIHQKPILDYFQPKSYQTAQQGNIQMAYQNHAYNVDALPPGPEKSVAMRKLLESFDAAMRAAE